MAHREWRQRLKELSDKINIDELAKLLGLTSWEEQEEYAQDYSYENAGIEPGDDDETRMAKEAKVMQYVYRSWHDAVEGAAIHIFGEHDLELQPLAAHTLPMGLANNYRIVPIRSWENAASKIISTINGVGMFEFGSVKEFADSGPYTVRQAVLSHLHHMKHRSEVYGTDSPRNLYEHYWREP